MRAILFDLDGTLLDIELGRFLDAYFSALSEAAAPRFPGTDIMEAVLASTRAMQAPHPGRTNRETFNTDFADRTGIDLTEPANAEVFDAFYRDVFPTLGDGCGPVHGARRAVMTALELDMPVVVATQPIFPRAAIEHRLAWAGLSDLGLEHLTTYEVMHACKPQPEYFREAARLVGCEPADCIMVGDDRSLDMPAADIGMQTYYVGGGSTAANWRGDMNELTGLLLRLAVADA